MNTLRQRVLQYLPTKAYCSMSKCANLIRTKEHAVKFPTVQLNPPHICAWIIFDIDEVFKGFVSDFKFAGTYKWEDVNLPIPNYVAINPDNGRYHLVYAVSPVFTTENARVHPLEYLAAIERTYTRLLNADSAYTGLMTHNPLHYAWDVIVFHNHEYTLAELQNDMKLDQKKKTKKDLGGYSRHIDLFDTLRFYAYERVVNSNVDYDALYTELLDLATQTNTEHFNAPLALSSLRAVSKSVAKYCIRNRSKIYVGNKPKERKLQLDESQPLATRQALGAYHSHKVRSNDVLEKMQSAYNALVNESIKATQKAVQERAGVGIATVKRYWKEIK